MAQECDKVALEPFVLNDLFFFAFCFGSIEQVPDAAQRCSDRIDFAFEVGFKFLRGVERIELVGLLCAAALPAFIVLEEQAVVVDIVHESLSLIHERGES